MSENSPQFKFARTANHLLSGSVPIRPPEKSARVFAFMEDEMAQTGQASNYNQLQGAIGQGAPNVVAPTISSAVGKIDNIGARLNDAVKALTAIADSIGGPRAVAGTQSTEQPAPTGAVNRLHEAADHAHEKMSEIEGLISSISRMLG